MNRTLTLWRLVSLYAVTKIAVITVYIVTALLFCNGFWHVCQAETVYDNGAVHDFHPEITYPHFRFEPFWRNALVIDAGADEEHDPKFNPCWQGRLHDRLIITQNWWAPYPSGWGLTDNGIAWVRANLAIDANNNQVPDYWEFDYNADGHVNLSDLSWFGQDYGYGKRWDLSDFSAMGVIYDKRRAE